MSKNTKLHSSLDKFFDWMHVYGAIGFNVVCGLVFGVLLSPIILVWLIVASLTWLVVKILNKLGYSTEI